MAKKLESTRPYKAGVAMGKSIVEMVNLMYQNKTAAKFFSGLRVVIISEYSRRSKDMMEVEK